MLVVKKFGGSSVGDLKKIDNVVNRIIENKSDELVVVVSAMAKETDKLISYATYFNHNANLHDMDRLLSAGETVTSSLLAIALQARGYKAISFSGIDAGVLTDSNYTKAKILSIDTKRVKKYLKMGYIVVVAGFQGADCDGNITTLGRGGSDLSAVSLACALNADLCEIYTDVDGVYTTDPRIEPKAKKIDVISYDEMLELAGSGAKVLQTRCVEVAKKYNIEIVTRSTFSNNSGTLVTMEDKIVEKSLITGIVLNKNESRISISGVEDRPGGMFQIFDSLAKANINVDVIVQTKSYNNFSNIDFTVSRDDFDISMDILKNLKDFGSNVTGSNSVVKVSIVGIGMRANSGVAGSIFQTLFKEGINIELITTSDIKISVIIDEKYGELAVRALHEANDLGKLE